MKCRVCNQTIVFVRGSYPGRKRISTRAVHESDLPAVLAESKGEVVTPHPGVQRKLRQPLERSHHADQATVPGTGGMPPQQEAEQQENTQAYANVSG